VRSKIQTTMTIIRTTELTANKSFHFTHSGDAGSIAGGHGIDKLISLGGLGQVVAAAAAAAAAAPAVSGAPTKKDT